jgi:hypothetical protein
MGANRATSDDAGDEPVRIGLAGAGGAGGAAPVDPEAPGMSDDDRRPTRQFVGGAVGDRCANCGAPLAGDQFYCVNCGERRGKPRFALGTAAGPAAAVPPPPRRQRRPGLSSSAALVAGVGTLLLAMGVGVLIGKTNTSSGQRAATPPVQVTVSGAGGGAAAPAASTAAAPKVPKAKTKAKAKATGVKHASQKQVKPAVSHKQAAKAAAAAQKVLGTSNSKNLPPATVTQGQAGHGPGFKNGKFTGTFFGQ